MIINTISSNDLFLKNVWSVQLFLPKEELQTNDEFKLTKLEKLVYERRENITLSSSDQNVNYIGLENIEAKTGRISLFSPKQGEEIKSTCKRFYKGDILYGRLRPTLNKVYYNDYFKEGVCTTEIIVLSCAVFPIRFFVLFVIIVIKKRNLLVPVNCPLNCVHIVYK